MPQKEYYAIECIPRESFDRVLVAVVPIEKRESLLPYHYVDIPDGDSAFSGIAAVRATKRLYEEYRRWISGERKAIPKYEISSETGEYELIDDERDA